ncbi:hypothetical protein ACHAXR_005689 [Thalassiosira sp. AJA248-18]
MMEGDDINFSPNLVSCSSTESLSVPTEFIFKLGSNQKNFIFSKSEVSTLLRVSMLASELDAILTLVYDALDRSHKCKTYRKYIQASNGLTPTLRALLPILDVHSETSESALKHATSEDFGISRVLNELEGCANDLSKFAEQNHNMSDQLECCMAPGQSNTLSDEKRAIAEIEEVIVERIQNLSGLALGSSLEDINNGESDNRGKSFTSMSDLCERLFSKKKSEAPEPPTTGDFSESQMFAAEALQIMHSDSRG